MADRKKIAFFTLGCKLNYSETSQLSRQFPPEKFEVVDFKDIADIYVINTCIVTEKAGKKSRAAIRQAKKRNPNAMVAAVGCYSELKSEELSVMKDTNVVLGASQKFALPQYLEEGFIKDMIVAPAENLSGVFIPSYSGDDRTRTFFKIQDGCDYFCSYCIVPLARGRSRSGSIDDTISLANEIASTNVKEIILTGVNVGDFGRKNGEHFIDLLKQLDKIQGIERIRLSSIEPELLTNEIIDFVASSEKFLPHFHIPLQSANDKVLKGMKRRYEVALFTEKVITIKEKIPYCCIAVDIIVGFPGETESDFEESYQYLAASQVSYMHVFTYSERDNTSAASLPDVVPNTERTGRSRKMIALSEKKKLEFYKDNIGTVRPVLFESGNEKGMMYGFTDNYIKVKTPFDAGLINEIKNVKLEGLEKDIIFVVKF